MELVAVPVQGARIGALIDLDNVLISDGRLLGPIEALPVFAALDAYVDEVPTRMACGRSILRDHMGAVAVRAWGITMVHPTPNAADLALLEAGRELVSAGVTDLVVVSGDHGFASLAGVARLHVISHRHKLSTALQLAATTVTYLPSVRSDLEAIA
jgi:hypothetical protein